MNKRVDVCTEKNIGSCELVHILKAQKKNKNGHNKTTAGGAKTIRKKKKKGVREKN